MIEGIIRPPQRQFVTDRQIQVLEWMGCNKTDCEVGKILGISATTVVKYVLDSFQRFEAYKRTALPPRAAIEGILYFEDFS